MTNTNWQRHLITDVDGKAVGIADVQGTRVRVNLAPGYSIQMSANFDPTEKTP